MNALPAGAGAVRCTECGAEARADGTGAPIVINHARKCVEPRIPRLPEWAQIYIKDLRARLDYAQREHARAQDAADIYARGTRAGAGPFTVNTHEREYGTPPGTSIAVELPEISADIDETADGGLYVSTIHTLLVVPLATNSIKLIEEKKR